MFAVLSGQVSNSQSSITNVVATEFKKIDATWSLDADERQHLENWVSRTFKGVRILKRVYLVPQLLAVSIVASAGGTLYQAAIWGEKCVIGDATLAWFSLVSLLVAPAVYLGFRRFIGFVEQIIAAKAFLNKQATAHLFESYRLSCKAREMLSDMDVISRQLDEQAIAAAARKVRDAISRVLHPIVRYRTWKRKRLTNKLRREAYPRSN